MEQGIDEGAGVDAGAGVDHHAGGLIDGDDGGVFVEDAERDVFGSGFERREVGGFEIDEVAGVEGLGGAGGRAIDESAAGFDPILDSGAAVLWELGVEVVVEAAAGRIGLDGELHARTPDWRCQAAQSRWVRERKQARRVRIRRIRWTGDGR